MPAGVTHHLGQAPDDAEAPWLVSSFERQETEISEASLPLSFTDALTVTIAALTEDQANFILDQVCESLIGTRVEVEGWQVGAIQPPSVRGPYAAGLKATDTDLKYQVIRATFPFTVSR
ncbi:hypothetical protein [Propionicimonas paludicola]|nr:hypothetical protein [Propionicimonas paludicola]